MRRFANVEFTQSLTLAGLRLLRRLQSWELACQSTSDLLMQLLAIT